MLSLALDAVRMECSVATQQVKEDARWYDHSSKEGHAQRFLVIFVILFFTLARCIFEFIRVGN